MSNIQIRIRVSDWSYVIQYIGDYIQRADRSFSFHHDLSGNNHYHVYLFDIDIKEQSIRKKLHNYLHKTSYAVKSTAGKYDKLPITPLKAYQYGTTEKLIEPIHYRGFDDDELNVFKESASAYYNLLSKPKEPVSAVLVTREDHFVVRADKTWEKLVNQIDRYKDKSVKQIKSMIAAQWINEGKAIPRPSDCHRYAVSIHYRLKFWNKEDNFEVPDWALEGEYS